MRLNNSTRKQYSYTYYIFKWTICGGYKDIALNIQDVEMKRARRINILKALNQCIELRMHNYTRVPTKNTDIDTSYIVINQRKEFVFVDVSKLGIIISIHIQCLQSV